MRVPRRPSVRLQDELPTIERLSAAGGRGALDPTDAVHGLEGIAGEPVLGRLGFEVLQ